MEKKAEEELLTTGELAKKLKVTKAIIYQLRSKKKLRGFKIGRSLRFHYSTVLKELSEGGAHGDLQEGQGGVPALQ